MTNVSRRVIPLLVPLSTVQKGTSSGEGFFLSAGCVFLVAELTSAGVKNSKAAAALSRSIKARAILLMATHSALLVVPDPAQSGAPPCGFSPSAGASLVELGAGCWTVYVQVALDLVSVLVRVVRFAFGMYGFTGSMICFLNAGLLSFVSMLSISGCAERLSVGEPSAFCQVNVPLAPAAVSPSVILLSIVVRASSGVSFASGSSCLGPCFISSPTQVLWASNATPMPATTITAMTGPQFIPGAC